ncbi:MAG: sugar kinase, partial [Acidobacteria bacterium]
CLGFEIEGLDEDHSKLEAENFHRMIESARQHFPNFKVVATTLRNAKTATVNDWGAVCYVDGEFYRAPTRENLEIFDRIGGGDSFASGLIYGFLTDKGPQYAVDCGAAHGALAMTTPGDTTMATLAEVEKLMKGGTARVAR